MRPQKAKLSGQLNTRGVRDVDSSQGTYRDPNRDRQVCGLPSSRGGGADCLERLADLGLGNAGSRSTHRDARSGAAPGHAGSCTRFEHPDVGRRNAGARTSFGNASSCTCVRYASSGASSSLN